MTTYPIDFPAKAVSSERLTLTRRQAVTESTTTYAVQVVQTGSQWQLSWRWPRMTHAMAEEVNAWIHSLQGQVGSFRYRPRQAYLCPVVGKTLSLAAYSYNTSAQIGGYAAGEASQLRRGQYIQLGEQLVLVSGAAAAADGAGHITVSFEPALRVNLPVGTPVNLSDPCGIFRLNASADLGYTLDPDRLPEFGEMAAREVI